MKLNDCQTLILCPLLLACYMSCGAQSCEPEGKIVDLTDCTCKSQMDSAGDVDLINTVYERFVFAIDAEDNGNCDPEKYFTPNALKKLQDDYEFDCPEKFCYAYYALRTDAQDSKAGSDETSRIHCIEPAGDGWYVVSYQDMGWAGKTRVKIVSGKIDDYERIVEN